MTSMVESAIEIIGNNTVDAVFDKGYYTAEEIYKSQKIFFFRCRARKL